MDDGFAMALHWPHRSQPHMFSHGSEGRLGFFDLYGLDGSRVVVLNSLSLCRAFYEESIRTCSICQLWPAMTTYNGSDPIRTMAPIPAIPSVASCQYHYSVNLSVISKLPNIAREARGPGARCLPACHGCQGAEEGRGGAAPS